MTQPFPTKRQTCVAAIAIFAFNAFASLSFAAETPPANKTLSEYLRRRVEDLSAREPCVVATKEEWEKKRPELRRRIEDMLGLSPMPPKGDLRPTVTGKIERDGVIVEKLHFQSLPGLYVTANFYRPAEVKGPLPTILYVCGHSRVVEKGISYGNKVGYQHHGAWFAKNGYCCLLIDTIQLGEIEGIHHGTYKGGMLWWFARGYTPAGVEAWNSIRALDYLETRPEVDRERIGVTGRSGGGAYSWWVAALDDRPKCFVPVAGVTDLQNHVVDGCIEGHCDCMFMVNRDGWDFATLVALAAPRPCLLANTDKDKIFPLDGVVRIHDKARHIYRLMGAGEKLGLLITEGPHKDTQDLQLPALRWFNRFLRGIDEPIRLPAEKLFTPQELKVFASLPADATNKSIHETFVPLAVIPSPPSMKAEWERLRAKWMGELGEKVFSTWPKGDIPLDIKVVASASPPRQTIEFTSEPGLRPKLVLVGDPKAISGGRLLLRVLGETEKPDIERAASDAEVAGAAYLSPRNSGESRWRGTEKDHIQLTRRFALLGSTVDEGRVWDVRRAIAALQAKAKPREIVVTGRGSAAGLALYAALFESSVTEVRLDAPTTSHQTGPTFLNVLRVLDTPQAVALAFPRRVVIAGAAPSAWAWPQAIAGLHGGEESRLQFVSPSEDGGGK